MNIRAFWQCMFTFFTYQVLLNFLQFHQLRVLSQLLQQM